MRFAEAAAQFIWNDVAPFWALALVFHVFERALPAERGQPWQRMLFNLLWLPLFSATTAITVGLLSRYVTSHFAFGPLYIAGRPDSLWGTAWRFLAYLLVWDFFNYWFHRVQHMNAWMWTSHKLHHTELSLNASSSFRVHWLTPVLGVFLLTLPMGLLVDFSQGFVGFGLVYMALIMFTHANVRLELGPLTPWVCGPQQHRIHHSIRPEHHNKNFAAFFPIWDILFGTYHQPKAGEWPATGVADEPESRSLVAAWFQPFTDAWQLARRSAR